jgi:error-prone DNA polymerase
MATIPAEDPRTFEMVCRADTVGVFQIESRAQMAMLPRLKPRRFYDLVIEISLVRPGPIAGDMVHPYLRRRRGLESVEYPHPCLEPVLEKTLGVPLFQEQVMKLAMVAADYSPGEADQLRRDMAAWRREGRMEKHRKRMVSRMLKKEISPEFADRVFNQIRGFGEYGFPESHAASFALICYATAWLKCHYPAEFTCALLNAQPMGFYSPATIVEEARRHEVAVRGVDVRHSEWDCTMEPHEKKGFAVRMGLRYVKGMGEGDYERIDRARRASPFYDLADFARRTRLDSKTFGALARSGALFVFESNRRTTLWKTGALSKSSSDPLPLSIPDAEPGFGPLTSSEEILWDHDTTHHSTAGHPLSVVRAELSRQGVPTAREIAAEEPDTRVDYAGLVICRQRPKTASGVVFLTLEDETGFVNVVLWTDVYEKYRLLVKTQPFLGVTGKVQVEDEVVHVIGERLWKPCCSPATSVSSRDFH